jgi:hypothetical protein
MNLEGLMKYFDRQKKQLRRNLQSLNSVENMREIADVAVEVIYKRTKSGRGVTGDSGRVGKKKLDPLSDPYIRWRKRLLRASRKKKKKKLSPFQQKFKPGPFFSPRRSNLTLTGQMLNSFEIKTKRRGFRIQIANNPRWDTNKSNRDIAEYVSVKRPFLALTEPEKRIVIRRYRELLRKIVLSKIK